MTLISETVEINGKQFRHTFSDAGMMIERAGVLYLSALDPAEIEGRNYVETDVPAGIGGDDLPGSMEGAVTTEADKLKMLEGLVEQHINRECNRRGYETIYTCLSFSGSKVPQFRKDAEVAGDWRDAVWLKCREMLAQYRRGEIAEPTPSQVLAALPVIQWVDVD